MPNPFLYFIAAQMQHLTGWLCPEPSDPIRNIVCTQVSCGELVECIEAGELGALTPYPTLQLIDKVWNKTKQHLQYTGYTNWSRIWNNRNYLELNKLENFSNWLARGVKYIPQLYCGCILRDFQSLCTEFNLPNTSFFQYLQLRHAITAQAVVSTWELSNSPVITQLILSSSRKGQISSLYGSLLGHVSKAMALNCRAGWEADIEHISDEEWTTILDNVLKISLSSSQKLTQLFIIHRTYRTPEKLHRWRRRDDPLCPRCLVDTGTLVHMLWKCPKLHRYWAEVISTINSIWNLRFTTDPKLCLLGWLDEEQYTPHTYIAILRTLFLARKLIARKWLSITAPTHT